jgi:hypothetical protein
MKTMAAVGILLLHAALVAAQPSPSSSPKAGTLDALQAEIEALKPAQVAWREIAWKTCLLDGLETSRTRGKPVLLWVFIDRPCDDARC